MSSPWPLQRGDSCVHRPSLELRRSLDSRRCRMALAAVVTENRLRIVRLRGVEWCCSACAVPFSRRYVLVCWSVTSLQYERSNIDVSGGRYIVATSSRT